MHSTWRRSRRRGFAVAAATAALLAVTQGGSVASPVGEPERGLDVESSVISAVEGLESLDLADGTSASFEEAGDSIVLDGESETEIVGQAVQFGDADLGIELPVEASLDVTEDGYAAAVDSQTGLGVVVVPTEEGAGARTLTVAEESYSEDSVHEYRYNLSLAEDVELRQLSTGDVVLVTKVSPEDLSLAAAMEQEAIAAGEVDLGELEAIDPETVGPESDSALAADEVIVGGFMVPWSVDANGESLPTSYATDGDTLIQVVDTEGAAFPVVSDPLPAIVILIGSAALRYGVTTAARAFMAMRIGIGTRLVASNGYTSFARFKAVWGNAKANHQWHHIVEQSQATRFGATIIHNKANLVQIPTKIHQQCVSARMATSRTALTLRNGSRTFTFKTGSTMRSQVQKYSLQDQHTIGILPLRYCGVQI